MSSEPRMTISALPLIYGTIIDALINMVVMMVTYLNKPVLGKEGNTNVFVKQPLHIKANTEVTDAEIKEFRDRVEHYEEIMNQCTLFIFVDAIFFTIAFNKYLNNNATAKYRALSIGYVIVTGLSFWLFIYRNNKPYIEKGFLISVPIVRGLCLIMFYAYSLRSNNRKNKIQDAKDKLQDVGELAELTQQEAEIRGEPGIGYSQPMHSQIQRSQSARF